MKHILSLFLCGLFAAQVAGNEIPGKTSPGWVGKGKYRILVRIDPLPLPKPRKFDERPARIELSGAEVRKLGGSSGKIDVASIQVAQFDGPTGQPIPYRSWVYGQEEWEIPFRWYDGSIPQSFPEGNVVLANGDLQYENHDGWGYFYETLGEWDQGGLAWIHTQRNNEPSYYEIYFDLLPAGQEPAQVERRGFLGDGFERITEIGPTTDGLRLGRVEVVDWNGDGLADLLLGSERGGLVWFPNRGTKTEPRFPYPKLIFLADGKPFDVGFNSSPLVVDWDGDGKSDLLSGTYPNKAIWFKNVGTNAEPSLQYKGVLLADGKPLGLPHTPIPEGEGIYIQDYHPQLAAADWDGDGDIDLLAGGYVTGMIFWFENVGRDANNLPILKFRDAIEADGKPLDTEWCASPNFADFDNDGDLDLITGSMAMTKGGGDSASSEKYLYYFENIGGKGIPKLTRRPFPVKGTFHKGAIATPRAVDLNADGLLDLVVSESSNIYIFMNVGTKRAPLWRYDPHALVGRWNTANPVHWGSQLLDWNGDGHFDIVSGFSVSLNDGKGNPEVFSKSISILPAGEEIFHKSPRGDQWNYLQVTDLDSDGRMDILYGVHEGNVYFHRNLSTGSKKHFDTVGVLLKTTDGNPIRVGVSNTPHPFDVLQGARTTLTSADYNRDGKTDLVVGDNYGKTYYYRNTANKGEVPTFALPVLIADLNSRLVPTTADWNSDGWPDILVGAANGDVALVLNSGKTDGGQFLAAEKMKIPLVPFGSTVMAYDWNGDGDIDLLNNASYGYLCWYDRSFLEHGYAVTNGQKLEVRP